MKRTMLIALVALLLPTIPTVNAAVLIPSNAIWNYLDNGSDEGTAWRSPAYDDSGWPSGRAELGHGDGDETTVVSSKRITYYFRHSFNVPNAGLYSSLTVRLKRDDGGIVHLNGAEIYRNNMPAGPVTYLTRASTEGDESSFFSANVTNRLQSGRNTLAVEIHEASNSEDVSFALELIGQEPDPLVMHINEFKPESTGAHITVSGTPGDMFTIESSHDNMSWVPRLGETMPASGVFFYTNAFADSFRAYRARSESGVFSANVVGAMQQAIAPGYAMIANHLLDTNNTVAALGRSPPPGTSIYKIGSDGRFAVNNFLQGWSDTAMELRPGDGVFIRTPVAVTVSFKGEVLQGTLINQLPSGFAMCSSIVPQAGPLQSQLQFPTAPDDTIYVFNPGSGSYTIYYFDPFDGVWVPGEPSINVGQAFWSRKDVAADWSRNFVIGGGSGYSVTQFAGTSTVAQVNLFTYNANSNKGRVFLPNGTTLVSSNFFGQLYAGTNASEASLVAIGAPVQFLGNSGYIRSGTVVIPSAGPGDTRHFQLRVWDSAAGANYEEAVAGGGSRGKSTVFSMAVGGGLQAPPDANNFNSFPVTVTPPTLTSIAITPTNASVVIGSNLQFTATGTFSDGSSRLLTAGLGTWIPKASIATPSFELAAAELDGALYVAGGWNGNCSPYRTLEKYDAIANAWEQRPVMPTPRAHLGVGALNGVLYAAGGFTSCGPLTAVVEAYDPLTGMWSTKAPLPTGRSDLGIVGWNGLLYAVGGNDNVTWALGEVLAYDPLADSWSSRAPMLHPRSQAGVALLNGILYAVGGQNSAGHLVSVEAYDPPNGWSWRSPLPAPRSGLALVALNGVLYAIGGNDDTTYATVYAYNPAIDAWTTVRSMLEPRGSHAAAAVDGVIYAIGGHNPTSGVLASVEAFTPPEVLWFSSNSAVARFDSNGILTALSPGTVVVTASSGGLNTNTLVTVVPPEPPDMPPATSGHRMVFDAARNEIVLFGGYDGSTSHNDTWIWDGTRWALKKPATRPGARHYAGLAYDESRQEVVLFGGANASGQYFFDTWIWNGTNWMQRIPLDHPPHVHEHAMGYDAARQEVILFGGDTSTGPGTGTTLTNTTWIWNGTNWFQKYPSQRPPTQRNGSMTYDAGRQELILYGGTANPGGGGDDDRIWVWDGANWTARAPTQKPAAIRGPGLAYDSLRDETVVFGGLALAGASDDTWIWDGANWLPRNPANHPSPRFDSPAAYHSTLRHTVLFGGINGAGNYLNDTWLWNGTNWFDWSIAPPVIIEQPSNVTVAENDPATFIVAAFGKGLLSYQWFFNGTNAIAGATNDTLTLTDVQAANNGNYRVVVANSAGSVTSTPAILSVFRPFITILNQPVEGSLEGYTVAIKSMYPAVTDTEQCLAGNGESSGLVALIDMYDSSGRLFASNLLSASVNGDQFASVGSRLLLGELWWNPEACGGSLHTYWFTAFDCAAPPSGLVAWWKAEGNALDSIGSNHGALSNSPTFVAGKVGQAFRFDGENDFVRVPHNPELDPGTNSFTIEGWIRTSTTNGLQVIASKYECGQNCPPGGGSLIYFAVASGKLNGFIRDGDQGGPPQMDGGHSLYGNRVVADGLFHHVACVRDQSSGQLILYVDGVLDTNETLNAGGTGSIDDNDEEPDPLLIGAVFRGGQHNVWEFFEGAIDELSLYRHALAPNDIAAIYTAGSAGKCPPQPLQLMVQGSGTNIVSPQRDTYPFGSTVTITPVPNRYHRFLAWSDGDTSSPRIITIGLSNNYTAIFTNTVPLENVLVPEWQQSFGGTNEQDLLAIQQTTDGGFILGGWSTSPPGGNKTAPHYGEHDFWVVKLDASGAKQWDKSYGGDASDALTALQQTSDGGYIFAGNSASSTNGNKTTAGFGDVDYWIVKTDSAGNPQWQRSFGGSGYEQLFSVQQTADGGYVLGGFSYSPGDGNKTATNYGGADYWVVKLDSSGDKQWDKSFGGNDADFCRSVRQLDNGGYVVAGTSISVTSGTKSVETTAGFDFWVEVLDENGNDIDEHAPIRPPDGGGLHRGTELLRAVIVLSSSEFLLAGTSTSETFGQAPAQHHGTNDFAVAHIDLSEFEQQATAERAYGGSDVDLLHAFESASDGGFVAGGPSFSGISGDKTSTNFGDADFWIVKTDSAGSKQWDLAFGGSNTDFLNALDETSDGGYIFGGTSASGISGNKTTPLIGTRDWWVIKLGAREAPVGTPIIFIDGRSDPRNAVTVTNSAVLEIQSSFERGSIFFTLDGSDPDYGELYAGPVTLGDDAVVRAVAYSTNFTSAEADPVIVTVLHTPMILAQPQSQRVAAGSTVNFTVAATGDPPLTYQWFRDGEPISGQTGASFIISNVHAEQAGSYSVSVANAHGLIESATVTLLVVQPSSIHGQPTNMTVTLGSSVTFCVDATGGEPFQYQWRRNGVNIPDATSECLTIDPVLLEHGGTYDVIVANEVAAVLSSAALLQLILPMIAAGDDFADRTLLTNNNNGSLRANNVGATNEDGEPNHAGKPGGSSVWYQWFAPFDGLATFRTVGSTFDTLLAAYTGPNVSDLTVVASDEDTGGFLTSLIRFNVVGGREYAIAVDGFGETEGDFTLSWEVSTSTTPLPVIYVQPQSQTVFRGTNVLFTAAVSNATHLQWLFNGTVLWGQNSAELALANVGDTNVGNYRLAATNSAGDGVLSEIAVLEIGLLPRPTGARSADKFDDLRPGSPIPELAGRAGKVSDLIVVSGGIPDQQVLNNTGSTTSLGESNACRIGGASRWFQIRAGTSATLRIDTIGSQIDTIVSVLMGTNSFKLIPIVGGCDDSKDGTTIVKVPGNAGTNYSIQVDAPNGTNGIVYLRWGLGFDPTNNQPQPVIRHVSRLGDTVTLTCNATGTPDPTFYWWRSNGVAQVCVATNTGPLTLTNVQAQDQGAYSVIASNFFGILTNMIAEVVVQTNALIAAQSSFDSDTEDWGVSGATLHHFSDGGNPGGHLSVSPLPGVSLSNGWYWVAPAPYLGNKFYCYEGSLSFELRQSITAAQQTNPSEDVILEGAGLRLVIGWPKIMSVAWVTYRIPFTLSPDVGWRVGSLAGPPPTELEFLAVLTSLTNLMIRGVSANDEFGQIDSVLLLGSTTPALSIRRDGGDWLVEWPQALGGYTLERATILASDQWLSVGQVMQSGNLNSFRVDTAMTNQFFRLRKP